MPDEKIPTLADLIEVHGDPKDSAGGPDAVAACELAARRHHDAMGELMMRSNGEGLRGEDARAFSMHSNQVEMLQHAGQLYGRRNRAANELRAQYGQAKPDGPNGPAGDGRPGGELRDTARRLIDRAAQSGELPDYAAERAEALVCRGSAESQSVAARWAVAAGAAEYRTAFAKLLADPTRGHMLWTAEEQRAYQRAHEVRAAMGLTDANGGYMVPLTLDPAIILTNDGSINPLRQLARVVQTATDQWQGVTSAGATAEWKAEGAEAADGAGTVDDAPIPVHLGDVDVLYSYEIGMDAVDFLGQLQRVIMDAAENLMATAYTTGSGTGQPKGIITALAGTSSEINTTGTEALDSSDPYALQNALGARWSPRAVFMSHIATANGYRQMETAAGALKFPELRQTPPMLLGKAWHENSNMDSSINTAATGNNYVLLYGDVAGGFVIVDRIGATFEILPAFGSNRRPTAQRHAFLTFRTGSDVVVPQALRLLDVPTTA
ncbi:phage major capsid protein [Actinomadura geliboluensis]|uniref:phage major capsid protein n=1 Tax=Actinomadura geliboluensis TaxID=882440 RepID=UPI003718934E